jgi:hypothetical protein
VDLFTTLFEAIDLQAVVLLAILLVAAFVLARVVNDDSNTVQASDFFSSRGTDGKDHGDPKKLAATVFIFSSTLFVGYTFWAHKIDNFWVVSVFFGWAIAMLGIDMFSAWARSFVDRRFGQAPPPPTQVHDDDDKR